MFEDVVKGVLADDWAFLKCTALWSALWLVIIALPPGMMDKTSVMRLSGVHGLTCSVYSVCTLVYEWDPGPCAAATISFFLVDMLVMLKRDSAEPVKKRESSLRKVEYAHHIIGIFFGVYITYNQHNLCTGEMGGNLYTYAQTNELSTPLFALYRLTNNPLVGGGFALAFFLCRIVFNFSVFVPYAWRSCNRLPFFLIIPLYQGMQCFWMWLIVARALKARKTKSVEKIA